MTPEYERGTPSEEQLGEALAAYQKALHEAITNDREPPELEEFLKGYPEDVQLEYERWELAQDSSEVPRPPAGGYEATDGPLDASSVLRITHLLTFQSLHNSHGAMGLIYRFRDEDLKRDLALKVKRASASHSRFTSEATITATLDHPAIVPVFGIGETEERTPCYVTKLVQGERTLLDEIRRFHGERQGYRSVEFRRILGHFITACDAVSHAHENDYLHGDLKPEHIMIDDPAVSDEPRRRAYVVDWGLAKRISDRHAPASNNLHSGIADIEGTPDYMSPEMARGESPGIGSDVYALGVTLYVMLTARTPFTGSSAEGTLLKVRRREGFQPPRRVKHRIPRGLQAVCLKAMAELPELRYASVKRLGDDIERWLAGERPMAHHEIMGEGVWRWADRHRRAAVLVALILITGIGGIAWQWGVAVQERRTAIQACDLINELVTTPARGGIGRRNAIIEALDRVGPDIGRRFGRSPEIEARIRETMANTYRVLGSYAKGEPHARRALDLRRSIHGPDHRDTITTQMNLAGLFLEWGKLDEAETLMRRALDDCQRALSADDRESLMAMTDLGELLRQRGKLEEAELLLRRALDGWRRVAGDDDPETLTAVNNLGVLVMDQGEMDDAEHLLEPNAGKCRRVLGLEHPQTLTAINNLASIRLRLNRPSESGTEEELNKNLDVTARIMGEDHPYTVTALDTLITWYQWYSQSADAEDKAELFSERRWKLLVRLRGAVDPATLLVKEIYARLLQEHGKHGKAEPLLRELVERRYTPTAPDSSELADILSAYGWSLSESGNALAAEKLLQRSFDIRLKDLGAAHWRTANAKSLLGGCLTNLSRYAEAEPLLVDSYAIIEGSNEAPPAQKNRALERIIKLYEMWGKSQLAAEWRSKRSAGKQPAIK